MCAAIDVDRLSGDEAGILTDEEQAGRGNLVDVALPADQDAGSVRQATRLRGHDMVQGGRSYS